MRIETTADFWVNWLIGWQPRYLGVDSVYLHIKSSASANLDDETHVLATISKVSTYNDRGKMGASFMCAGSQYHVLFADLQEQLLWLRALRGQPLDIEPPVTQAKLPPARPDRTASLPEYS
eukprot:m.6284 g.6284  ORF g.6284 m.6284 type:complete len:121 (+) comp8364_c0_seq4:101-463(+)